MDGDTAETVTRARGTLDLLPDSAVLTYTTTEDGDTDTIAEQLAANGWTELDGVDNVYWHDVVDARQAAKDVPVFGTFTIGNTADVSTYGDASVNVTAYAVQKDSFASAAAAWNGAGFN